MADKRFEQRMSDSDALMWNIEKDPMLRSTITAVSILDRAPDHDRLRTKLEIGTRTIARLRQTVVAAPFAVAPPRWVVDPNFDIGFHCRFLRIAGSGPNGEGTIRDLLDMAAPIAMRGFDRARPLWEVLVIEGLEDGRCGLIQKVHHSVTDGVGGIEIALMLLDTDRDAIVSIDDAPPAPEPEVLGFTERLVDGIEHERRRILGRARRAVGAVPGLVGDPAPRPAAPATRPARPCGSWPRQAAR